MALVVLRRAIGKATSSKSRRKGRWMNFGANLTHKFPGRVSTGEFRRVYSFKLSGCLTSVFSAIKVLPKNDYSGQLGKKPATKDGKVGGGKTAQASFKEAAALCRAKVAKIVEECRRVNQKYRDPHFDLEFDLKTGRRDCLESLNNETDDESSGSDSEYIPGPRPRPRPPHGFRHDRHARSPSLQDGVFGSTFKPRSVKRVTEIFDDPKFYVDGPTANDVRQGRDGDCWLMAALCNLSNKPGLIERLCVAHNQDVGVYGFVFHRDGEWFSEIIDDKVILPFKRQS